MKEIVSCIHKNTVSHFVIFSYKLNVNVCENRFYELLLKPKTINCCISITGLTKIG